MANEPDPPGQAPNYVVNPLKRQSSDLLEKIGRFCFDLAEYKRQQSFEELEETPLDDEKQEELKETGGPVRQSEMVRCGKNCNGCPHGPYIYEYERDGDKVVSRYVGKEE